MRIMIRLSLASFVLCLCTVPIAQKAAKESRASNAPQHILASTKTMRGISRQRAVAIASKDARRKFTPLSRFKIIPCEQFRFWRIIYDGGGPEYVIDKLSGRIIRKRTIPQAPVNKTEKKASLADSSISRERAIEIARADAQLKYGSKGEDISGFAVVACEQAKVWRIIFDLKIQPDTVPQTFPNAAYPKYVIDKKTGEIIYRELN